MKFTYTFDQAGLEDTLDGENMLNEQGFGGRLPDSFLLIIKAILPEYVKKYNLIPWKKILKRSGKEKVPPFTFDADA